ncbi:MAG: phage holin family protein [Candidatus Tectomicrobia bacterium]|uniref:Phage holin family protein n=1 Tax=Tectimicrobiota bacterium TaxID=2528274 RepID=A0A932CLU4_UNCTE|nr:phage holin family protein [Candidatus Tectomicrobia bacterium]
MKGLIVRWLINAAALGITGWILKGIQIKGLSSLLIAALVLGLLNAFVRPILLFFTFPLNILTLGLFTFVINALLLLLVSRVVEGFEIDSFWSAFVGAILLSIISLFLSLFVGETGRIRYIHSVRKIWL